MKWRSGSGATGTGGGRGRREEKETLVVVVGKGVGGDGEEWVSGEDMGHKAKEGGSVEGELGLLRRGERGEERSKAGSMEGVGEGRLEFGGRSGGDVGQPILEHCIR